MRVHAEQVWPEFSIALRAPVGDGFIERRVVKHHECGLATELECHLLDRIRRERADATDRRAAIR
jgi:hypothetical protein